MDIGKNMAARIGGIMKAPQKALVWQFLDSKGVRALRGYFGPPCEVKKQKLFFTSVFLFVC